MGKIYLINSLLQKYFEVDYDDVKQRIYNSIIPFNPNFLEVSQNSPDLYGPIWIYTTLIFVIAAAGSLTKYLNVIKFYYQGQSTEEFFQSFIPVAASLVRFYVIVGLWSWFCTPYYSHSFNEILWITDFFGLSNLYIWILLHNLHSNGSCLCYSIQCMNYIKFSGYNGS